MADGATLPSSSIYAQVSEWTTAHSTVELSSIVCGHYDDVGDEEDEEAREGEGLEEVHEVVHQGGRGVDEGQSWAA